MSTFEVTTPITKHWLMRKTKDELASIVMANIDQIDLFAEVKRSNTTRRLNARELAGAREVVEDPKWFPGLGTARDWERLYREMVALLLGQIDYLQHDVEAEERNCEIERLRAAISRAKFALLVPAAEYVPAIVDAVEILEKGLEGK